MYYYIFQSPKNYSESKLHEKIKQHLTMLGLSGETTIVSPARNASELALMGIEKGYSTIVAIGSDEIINEVASNIVGSGAVLGIIPIGASTEIIDLMGTSDIKDATISLQKRSLAEVNMGYLEPGVNFLTSLTISHGKKMSIQAEINDFYIESSTDAIKIDNNLNVNIISNKKDGGFWKSIGSFFGKKENPEVLNSIFNAHTLKLRTHKILPVKIGSLVVAKTPITAYRKPEALKIIRFRSKIV